MGYSSKNMTLYDNDVGKNDNNKNEVRQEDKKMEVWESFLIDTITVVM